MELQNMTIEDDAATQALMASLTELDQIKPEPAPKFDLANDEAALLADLELATAAETETAIAQVEVTADTELDEEALAELDSDVKRAEVYSAQSVGAPVATPEEAAAVQKSSKRTKRANGATSKTPSTPRKSLVDLPDDAFQLSDSAVADRAYVMSRRPTQVKVAEKFDNLLLSLDAGKLPSRYVVTAAKLLNKTGSMTNADLIGAYVAEGLGKGTAASQAGQIMVLFSALGVALRSGQALTKVAESTIARKLDDVISKHVATA